VKPVQRSSISTATGRWQPSNSPREITLGHAARREPPIQAMGLWPQQAAGLRPCQARAPWPGQAEGLWPRRAQETTQIGQEIVRRSGTMQ
jgi:hypothetical protein